MTGLPLWAALPVALLAVAGAALCFLGSLGLLRLRDFYERLHAPTLATTLGILAIVLASTLAFSVAEGRPVLGGLLVVALFAMTTPVTLMLLARAARSREEGAERPPD